MARPSASDRMARVLAVVPWIASRGTVSIREVCDRFQISEDDLLGDLATVSMVGLHPYTPDTLVEVLVDDDEVSITYGNHFTRPLRLSESEALAIVSAGLAAEDLPGQDPDGPLARALVKLAGVLDIELGDDVDVVLDERPSAVRAAVEEAMAGDRVLHLSYFSHARGERSDRDVEPLRLRHVGGAWYLDAHCRSSGGHRVFRLDRAVEATVLDETFDPAARAHELATTDGDDEVVFRPGADLPRATLALAPEARWVVDHHPVEEVVEHADGSLEVTLAITAPAWLGRLLLQLGPTGRLVATSGEGSEALASAGPDAARAVLARYGSA